MLIGLTGFTLYINHTVQNAFRDSGPQVSTGCAQVEGVPAQISRNMQLVTEIIEELPHALRRAWARAQPSTANQPSSSPGNGGNQGGGSCADSTSNPQPDATANISNGAGHGQNPHASNNTNAGNSLEYASLYVY